MNIPDDKFAELVKKALDINNITSERLSVELKVSKDDLESWAKEENIPEQEKRAPILQTIITVVLNSLGDLVSILGSKKNE